METNMPKPSTTVPVVADLIPSIKTIARCFGHELYVVGDNVYYFDGKTHALGISEETARAIVAECALPYDAIKTVREYLLLDGDAPVTEFDLGQRAYSDGDDNSYFSRSDEFKEGYKEAWYRDNQKPHWRDPEGVWTDQAWEAHVDQMASELPIRSEH